MWIITHFPRPFKTKIKGGPQINPDSKIWSYLLDPLGPSISAKFVRGGGFSKGCRQMDHKGAFLTIRLGVCFMPSPINSWRFYPLKNNRPRPEKKEALVSNLTTRHQWFLVPFCCHFVSGIPIFFRPNDVKTPKEASAEVFATASSFIRVFLQPWIRYAKKTGIYPKHHLAAGFMLSLRKSHAKVIIKNHRSHLQATILKRPWLVG